MNFVRRIRLGLVSLALVGLFGSLAQPASAQPRDGILPDDGARLESAFLEILEEWAASSNERSPDSAPSDWVDLENQVLERAVGPLDDRKHTRGTFHKKSYLRAQKCLEIVQDDVFESLSVGDDPSRSGPDVDIALALFFVRAYIDAKSAPRRNWLAEASWERFEDFRDLERDAIASGAALDGDPDGVDLEARRTLRRDRALRVETWSALLLYRLTLIESLSRSRDLLAEVASRAPDDRFALYWLGFVEQQRGSVESAEEAFGRLLALEPDDAEAHLRRGTLRLALGESAAARADFASAARVAPPAASTPAIESVRRLAYQELARASRTRAAGGESFADVLVEGLAAFPDDRGLLHLAAEHASATRDRAALAEAVEALSKPRRSITPRFGYELPRRQGLAALRTAVDQDLEALFEVLRPRLRAARERAKGSPGERRRTRACGGLAGG